MRSFIFFLLSVLIILSSSHGSISVTGNELVQEQNNDPTRGQLVPDDETYEYRSMWVEGYQIVNISEVQSVVELARKYNFNCLSPLINGDYRGVFYDSKMFPKHPDVRWDFDPLMELIKEAHKYGIQVHPWWHTMVDPFFYSEHPEWGCVSSSGYKTRSWINPAYPEARSYVRNVTMEMVTKYPIDGLKLDTIRYPNSAYSYDSYTMEKFNSSGMSDFNVFRIQKITETVDLIYGSIMEKKPWLWVGADIYSSSWGRLNGVFQEPEVWSGVGTIDYVTPMLYTTSIPSYSSNLQTDLDGISCPVVAGTYLFVPGNTAHGSVPNETAGIQLMLDQVNTALSMGAWGICGFAYKFLRDYPSYGQALKDGPFSIKAVCPIKEQKVPVKRTIWNFDMDHDREGWNLLDSGHYYPDGGVWSVSGSTEAKFLSPRLNISSTDINVIEISLLIEEGSNCTLKIYWGQIAAKMDENRMIEKVVEGNGEWNVQSIHLDQDPRWDGVIRYLFIVPVFEKRSNITIDLISLHWMPYCIRDFAYLGPFTSGGDQDLLERKFIENEGNILPSPGDVMEGRKWNLHNVDRDLIDFRLIFGKLTYNVVYAHIYIRSDDEKEIELRVGSSDGLKVWVNGVMSISSSMSRTVSPDQNITNVHLEKGMNSLFIKLAGYINEFSYYIRFTGIGNQTVQGLEYYSHIPLIEGPEIYMENGTWITSNDVEISWSRPGSLTRIISYQVSLDSTDPIVIEEPIVSLLGLEDGLHRITVFAIDELGFTGSSTTIEFGIDTIGPVVTGPFTKKDYTNEYLIEWNWSLENIPVSGLLGYEVEVSYRSPDGSVFVTMDPEMVGEESYTLKKRIIDGYTYYLKLRSISKSGNSFISKTSDPIIVDLSAPPEPKRIRTVLLDPINLTYTIDWDEVEDNVKDGLDHYQILIRTDVENWHVLMETGSNSFKYSRRIGTDPSFRIRSIDRAGNIGELSDPIDLEMKDPEAVIGDVSTDLAGEIITISSEGSRDIDGLITVYQWRLDDNVVSTDKDLKLTLEKGVYNILLTVWDDTGLKDVEERILIVEEFGESSIRNWIVKTSMKDVFLPVINSTVIVYSPQEEKGKDPLVTARADIIQIFLLIFTGLFIVSILIYYSLLFKKMKIEVLPGMDQEYLEENEELGGPPNWRNHGSDPSISRGPGIVTSLPMRSPVILERNMIHGGNDLIPLYPELTISAFDDDEFILIDNDVLDDMDYFEVEDQEDQFEILEEDLEDIDEFQSYPGWEGSDEFDLEGDL